MNAEQFKELVNSLDVGKKLPDSVYFHKDTLADVPEKLSKFITIVAKALKIEDSNWNLVKVFRNDFRLSLLNYPNISIKKNVYLYIIIKLVFSLFEERDKLNYELVPSGKYYFRRSQLFRYTYP